MTSQQLKDQISADITDKTADLSITAADVGGNMEDVVQHIDDQIADNVQTNLMPSATKSPSVNAVLAGLDSVVADVQEQIDEAITGIFQDAGNWDASGGTFPTTGTGDADAVAKGDVYFVTVAGTMGGVEYEVGESFRALVDAPGQTAGNWAKLTYVAQEATESTLGTVRYASDADVTSGTGEGVVTAEQLQEKLDNLPSGSQDLAETLGNGNTVTELNNKLTLTSGQIKLEDTSTGVAANLFRLALQFIKSGFTLNLRPPASLTSNRTQYLPDEDGTLAIQKYKSYVALISQSGTSAPTVTVLENSIGGTIIPSRSANGRYDLTFTGTPLTDSKTAIFITPDNSHVNFLTANKTSTSVVSIVSQDLSEGIPSYADGLTDVSIEIRVYN